MDRGIIPGTASSLKGCLNNHSQCPNISSTAPCPGSNVPTAPLGFVGFGVGNATAPNSSTYCASCRVCGDVCDGVVVTQTGFGIDTTELGLAQSLFMLGYSIAAILFGRMVHHFSHFKLMGWGLLLWCFSGPLSAVAGWTNSYGMFVGARILSGVGEASFQVRGEGPGGEGRGEGGRTTERQSDSAAVRQCGRATVRQRD
jgi:hypothetical protein